MVYDYIIVGAGLGGLSAGLNLAINNKKVLILEKNSLPGGLVTTFKRGRFEFDVSLYDLYDFGNVDHVGTIKNMFRKYGIEINTSIAPFNARIKVVDSKEDYEIKGDVEDFFLSLEKIKNGSVDNLKVFLKVTKDIHEALKLLEENKEINESDYPYFSKYLSYNTLDALHDLKISKDIIHHLCFLWTYLASPINKLSFIDFSEFMYKLIFKKIGVLNEKNIALALKMVKKYEEMGGKIYYNSCVTDISLKDNLKIVTINNGKKYKARHVICNTSKRYAFGNLIHEEDKEIKKLENARTLSPNGIVVYLGLNKDHKSLGLTNYKYYHYQNINSIINVKYMKSMKHSTFEAIVPNVVNENASPKNTTILVLKTSYYADVFNKVTSENYLKVKEELANNLIEQFEENFNIDIREYIEEIEIATPYTFRKTTNNINGSMMGYMRLGYDNAINRLINYEEELISGLSFVGASSIFGGGVDNAIYSGYYITNKLLKEDSNAK